MTLQKYDSNKIKIKYDSRKIYSKNNNNIIYINYTVCRLYG